MAARRVSSSTIDWAEFARKIPQAQKPAFAALKNKQDGYVRRIAALPASSPKIDWANYKAKITVAGMVDDFQKRYESLQIPYPKDTLSSQIDQQAVEQKKQYEQFVKDSKTRISGITEELAKWQAMMPVEEMNLEEALEAVPHLVVDPNKPSFWPHDRDFDEWKKMIAELREKGGDDHH